MTRPGRPRRTWLHHIQQDLGVTVAPATAWDSEVARGMEIRNGHRLCDNEEEDDDDNCYQTWLDVE